MQRIQRLFSRVSSLRTAESQRLFSIDLESQRLAQESQYFRSKEQEALENIRKHQVVVEQLASEARQRASEGDAEAGAQKVLAKALQMASAAIPNFGLPPTAFPPQRAAVSALLDQARGKAAVELIDRAIREGGAGAELLKAAKERALARIPAPAQSYPASEILLRAQALARAPVTRKPENLDISQAQLRSSPASSSSDDDRPLTGEGVISFDSFIPRETIEEIQRKQEQTRQAQASTSLVFLIASFVALAYLLPQLAGLLGLGANGGLGAGRALREEDVAEELVNGGAHWTQDGELRPAVLASDLAALQPLRAKLNYREWKAMVDDVEREVGAKTGSAKFKDEAPGSTSSSPKRFWLF